MNELVDDLFAWATALDGTEVPMVIVAGWWRCDPWAVELTFLPGHGEVVWLISRDLLRDGLTAPVGEGDVLVFPSDVCGRTALDLSSPNGHAVIALDTEALREFLTATYDAVPAGEELLWIPLDQELTELLNGSEL